jgi:hypothetical protein
MAESYGCFRSLSDSQGGFFWAAARREFLAVVRLAWPAPSAQPRIACILGAIAVGLCEDNAL